jgi:hypothetical protein
VVDGLWRGGLKALCLKAPVDRQMKREECHLMGETKV